MTAGRGTIEYKNGETIFKRAPIEVKYVNDPKYKN